MAPTYHDLEVLVAWHFLTLTICSDLTVYTVHLGILPSPVDEIHVVSQSMRGRLVHRRWQPETPESGLS